MIALLSVPNTGTWFTLNLIQSHEAVEEKVISYNAGFFGIGRREITRTNFRYGDTGCVDWDKTVYYRHILGNRTHGEIDITCMGHKAVIPMRDPLASLISRKYRNPLEPMYEHVDAFEYVATSPHAQNSFIFPIDTPDFKRSWTHRKQAAENLFNHIGLEPPESVHQWAVDNEPKNSMGHYIERDAYLQGEIETATRNCKGEFEYLKSKSDVLMPWLQDLGYKDLIWW